MAILTTAQILEYIQNFIKAKNPQTDAQPGSDLYDVVFHANAQVARRIFEEIERLQNNQSIVTTYGSDLDLIARNYNITRRAATYATGEVAFYTSNFLVDISIPVNTVISTKGTNVTTPIRFRTTKSVGMDVENKSTYFDGTAVRYQISTPIIAESPGTVGNVDAQIISQIVTSVSGIDGVINNEATSGGTEEENDSSLQQRCLESFVVSNIGTIYGYRKLLQDNFEEVLDAQAVGPFDENAVRATGVDIYTITADIDAEANQVQIQESFTYNTGDSGYTPIYRPVIDIDATDGTAFTGLRSFIKYPNVDADFQFIRDYTGERGLSVRSADRIEWLVAGIKPNTGSKVYVTYTYDQKIQDLQTFMDLDENKVVGADALIKAGLKAKAYIELTVSYFPDVAADAAEEKVSAALSQFLSEFKFGENLELSDLIIVAQTGKWTDYSITEVDYVTFDESNCYIYIEELSTTRYMSGGVITINVNEYIREGSVTIN